MKKFFLKILAGLTALWLPLSACAAELTDDLGRTVTIDSPKRVAVLIGSFADIWCLAGGKDSIAAAAADAFTDFDLDLSQDVVNLGSSKSVSLESILAADPDFIIASCNTDADLALKDVLQASGIPTAYFKVSTFEEYLNMLKLCTDITGHSENYTLYGEEVAAQVEAARSRNDGSEPSVLYLRVSASGCRVKNSRNSVLGEMLRALGARNIADSNTSLAENLSLEVILQEDPEHIFIVLQGSDEEALRKVLENQLTGNPLYAALTAVQNGNVHIMDPHLFNLKPNARWGIAYEELADILYPEN